MSLLCKELEFKHTKKLAFFKGMHNSVGENFHPPEKNSGICKFLQQIISHQELMFRK